MLMLRYSEWRHSPWCHHETKEPLKELRHWVGWVGFSVGLGKAIKFAFEIKIFDFNINTFPIQTFNEVYNIKFYEDHIIEYMNIEQSL